MPVADARNAPCAGDIRNDFHPGFFQMFFELPIFRCAAQNFVHQGLHGHLRGRFARTHGMFNFSLGRSAANGLFARRHFLQPVLAFQAAHNALLALVILAVTDHLAFHAYAVRQNVNVGMLGICMLGHHVLIVLESHALKVLGGYLFPLVVRQFFTGRQADAGMAHGLGQIGPQGSYRAELPRQFSRVLPAHIGVEDVAFLLSQVVFQGSAESFALNQFRYHPRPRKVPAALGAQWL